MENRNNGNGDNERIREKWKKNGKKKQKTDVGEIKTISTMEHVSDFEYMHINMYNGAWIYSLNI